MEETLIQYLEKQEYFQGENTRFLEVSIGNNLSDNVFQELIDTDGKYFQHLESKSYSRHHEEFSRYYFDDQIIQIDHLNKNKKTLFSDLLITYQKVKDVHNHYDFLLETREIDIDSSCIPSQDKFLNIEDFQLEIFTPNPHMEVIYNLKTKGVCFRVYYPANKKQVEILSEMISELEKIIPCK